MYTRSHHRRIEAALARLRLATLLDNQCYFGGGTAITLQLGEYRESIDIDFLCNNADGYRRLHQAVYYENEKALCLDGTKISGDLTRSREAVRLFIDLEDALPPIKVEIVREGYLSPLAPGEQLNGATSLSREDLIATKLLANTDRGLGRDKRFRDIIDIIMACHHWKEASPGGFQKAVDAYGPTVLDGIRAVHRRLRENDELLAEAFSSLDVNARAREIITTFITAEEDDCTDFLR